MSEPEKRNLPVPYQGGGGKYPKPKHHELMYLDQGAPGLEGQIFLLMNAFKMGMDNASEIASLGKLNGHKGMLVSTFEVVETKAMIGMETRQRMLAQYPELQKVGFMIAECDY